MGQSEQDAAIPVWHPLQPHRDLALTLPKSRAHNPPELAGMFGFLSTIFGDEVLNHWIASADDFTLSPQEFYEAAEKEIAALKIPGLELSRVDHAEGGLLSAQRTYLRLIRERLVFDVCACPFGTRYFFSCRTVYSPARLKFWHLLVVCLFFAAVFRGLEPVMGTAFAAIAVAALLLAIAAMFRNAVSAAFADVDTVLLKIPAFGVIYERFFRKDTYYRQDTRLMYLDTIPTVIRALAEAVTGGKGVKLIRQYQIAPLLGDLYKLLPPPKPDEPTVKR